MKVENDKQAQLSQNIARSSSAEAKTGVRNATPQAQADVTDKVELSGLKAEVERLKARAKESPDVDEAKVARIKQALESGEYGVDGKTLARDILKSHLLDGTE
jgi:negative regulator of flagellin synthesis FlgM